MALTIQDTMFLFIQMFMVACVWSYLYKTDNIFARGAAQIVISISTVHYFLNNLNRVYLQVLIPIMDGTRLINIIPVLAGVLFYTRLWKGKGWIASYSYSLSLGIGMGSLFTTYVSTNLLNPINRAITQVTGATTPFDQASALLAFIGTLCALSYWLFTVELKGPTRYILVFGRLFLMSSIGILYAQDVVWAQSLFIGAADKFLKFFRMVLLGAVA
ncbi:hypothetical protein JW865_08365 [Candidatus Bathyarchaeota archaeon]|nr:hypothetical protein [Candidatus Bathyarchaeota archaeon]